MAKKKKQKNFNEDGEIQTGALMPFGGGPADWEEVKRRQAWDTGATDEAPEGYESE